MILFKIAVILFVRMWVEMPIGNKGGYSSAVILFVRMWVEMFYYCFIIRWKIPSSSSWGCELKCESLLEHLLQNGHPLREDVSWNMKRLKTSTNKSRHPLREDVSWNYTLPLYLPFVHCHPLREDVSWNIKGVIDKIKDFSHPLREDVSWNSP